MLILLAFIIVFHITSAALLFIATIDSAWWVTDHGFYTDVWYRCSNVSNCTTLDETFPDFSAFRAIQATMVLSTILCCVAFFVFIFQLFRLKQGERFILTSIIQLLSCLCVMIAASVYTDRQEELHRGPQAFLTVTAGQYGYSYVLAWIAFAFTLLSGIMYLILRKRK